jgi:transcriptional regulator with XRE-family HTH domain
MTSATRRRSELGAFLRARRGRVQPADVGLPAALRRRTPGLRREEVAMLAGVGVTWYTWLEQGRPINASTQVLDSVARTLKLGEAERLHLYRLAEATPVDNGDAPADVPAAIRDVIVALDPCPAVLVNDRFNVLDSNDAHEHLFWDWHSLPCVHKNLLWCCITEPRARERYLTYAEDVPYLVARMRSGYGRHVGDPVWEEDIRRLIALSPEFAELWERHEVAEPAHRVARFRHADASELAFDRIELDVPAFDDLRIVVYNPHDKETAARLPLTRRT